MGRQEPCGHQRVSQPPMLQAPTALHQGCPTSVRLHMWHWCTAYTARVGLQDPHSHCMCCAGSSLPPTAQTALAVCSPPYCIGSFPCVGPSQAVSYCVEVGEMPAEAPMLNAVPSWTPYSPQATSWTALFYINSGSPDNTGEGLHCNIIVNSVPHQ